MRALKFRAWDKERGEWLSAGAILIAIHKGKNPINSVYLDVVHDRYKDRYRDRFVLMQFTGLKDKNSKDIYEGDSILLNGLKCTIVWNEDRAGFYYDTGYSKHQHQWPLTCDEAIGCEVIGNIYEAE